MIVDSLILCGGTAKRLRPYSSKTPKPLMLIRGVPFLKKIIDQIKKRGVRNIYIGINGSLRNYNLFNKFVKTYYIDHKNIKIINSGKVDIITRIKDTILLFQKNKSIPDKLLLCYGDTIAKFELPKYLKNKKFKFACLVTTYRKNNFGVLKVSKNKVKKFLEKPLFNEPINLGYFLFNKNLFESIIKFEKNWINFLDYLVINKKLNFFLIKNKYFTFNTIGEYYEIKNKKL